MEHDCANCPSKGHCDNESLARGMREAHAKDGVPGMLKVFEPLLKADLTQKDPEEQLLVSLSVALDILMMRSYQENVDLGTGLKAMCPEATLPLLEKMLTFHVLQMTQKMTMRLMDRLSTFGNAYGVALHPQFITPEDLMNPDLMLDGESASVSVH